MHRPEETASRSPRRRCRRRPAACALITGATGGIGRAFAAALPKETALVLTGRDEAGLGALELELADERIVTAVAADLATDEGLAAVISAANAAGVDLLINNAGLGQYGSFLDQPFEPNRMSVRVNVEAALALIHALVPEMIARAQLADTRAGLINMASSTAFVPVPTFATYAASKSFVLAFTESLAAELYDKPIDVLVSCPGAVRTAFGRRAGYERGSIPGAMSPERVARVTLDALGRQTTVVLGPASAAAFTPVALARGLFGQAFIRASRAMQRF